MGKIANSYKFLRKLMEEDNPRCVVTSAIKEEQDITLLVDILSIEFVPEHLRCFKSFDGISVIGYFLGTIRDLGYDVTYEEVKSMCEAKKKRFKTKKKLLIKESLEV